MQDFSLARRAMVDSQLRPQGVADRAVLRAMGRVERERFVPERARPLAYFDRSLWLAEGRAMMPPAALGRLLAEAAPKASERALVVGSGTGYSAALLQDMGLIVVALECDERLAEAARRAGVETICGDLAKGWPKAAPYNLILIDGAVEEIPDALTAQLSPSGRIAAGLRARGVTRLVVGTAVDKAVGLRSFADADLALLPGFERPRAFSF